MKHIHAFPFALASPLLCAGAAPAFSYPGSQAPEQGLLYFYTGDYPSLRPIIRRVREQGKMGGLTRGVFSTWLKVPDDGRTRAVARLNAGGGEGAQAHNTFALVVRPNGVGGREAQFGKVERAAGKLISEEWSLRAPWPEGKEWVHVTLAIEEERLGDSGETTFEGRATLTVDGRPAQGKFWNDVEGERCAGVALGGEGVGVGPTLFLPQADGALPSPQEIRRLRPKPMPRRAHPLPLMAWDFNGNASNTGVLPTLRWRDTVRHTPTPNGQGTVGTPMLDEARMTLKGAAFTIALVAKPELRDKAGVFSICLFPDTRASSPGRIMLKGTPTGVTLDYLPASTADCTQGDAWLAGDLADDAFHHFATAYDGATLRLFIDGEPTPGAIRLASRPVGAFMDEHRALENLQLA